MAYHSVVLVKQVPDTKKVTGKAMKEDGTVNRAALPTIFNPEDLNALEAALDVKDRFGGTVTAVTMGPPAACDVLRACLFRGADRAVLITDRRAAASDTLATSYILSCAVRRLAPFDLVWAGRQAIDGDTAQVGPQLAEKLDITQITYAEELISIEGATIRVRRNVGNGWEIVEGSMPVLLTAIDTTNTPRPAAAKRIMAYKKARAKVELVQAAGDDADEKLIQSQMEKLQSRGLLIDQWDLDDIEADLEWCGRNGSPTKVHRIQSLVLTAEGFTKVEPTEDGIHALVHELIEDHTIG